MSARFIPYPAKRDSQQRGHVTPRSDRVGRKVQDQLDVDETDGDDGHAESLCMARTTIQETSEMLDRVPDDFSVNHLTGRGDENAHKRSDGEAERDSDCGVASSTIRFDDTSSRRGQVDLLS